MEVRTRFAPSPTGSMHVGNARTAIFNWLFARHHGGTFVLRIEDTDQERSTKENEARVLEDLEWMGITWDEGPFRQSERMDIYKEYADKLVADGKAFHCFCTDEELDAKREKAMAEKKDPIYDGTCRNLNAEEVEAKKAAGQSYTIRFQVNPEDIIIPDLIKGDVNIKKGMFGDFVIVRSNGMPVYNFAVVIDDALMKITHVIRAEEHLSNTARQMLIYQALGFDVPVFAHTALILAQDGSKLSKRHGATSVAEYRRNGYLPEALFNYLTLIGWAPPEDKEKLPVEELIKYFDAAKISKSPGKFDQTKLNWLNGEYIKDMEPAKLNDILLPYVKANYNLSEYSESDIDKMLEICSGGLEFFEQIIEKVSFFFNTPTEKMEAWDKEPFLSLAKRLKEEVDGAEIPDEVFFKKTLKKLGKELELKGKNLFMPTRVFATGQEHGPDLFGTLSILGKEKLLKRLDLWLS